MRLKKKIRQLLESPLVPQYFYEMYFNRHIRQSRIQLKKLRTDDANLIDRLSGKERQYWQERIVDVKNCLDNQDIERHHQAGKLVGDFLIMHNGLKIDPLSYYSFPMLEMLKQNRGVHEPQEEKVFDSVVREMARGEGKVMLELGSYWSFYSMWFLQEHPEAKCIMVEPSRRNLNYGKRNFSINDLKGHFIHRGISDQIDKGKNITTVDEIFKNLKLDFIDVLHSDIQGFELKMLKGAKTVLNRQRVGYIFISTHSNDLHYECMHFLESNYGFQVVASADLDNSYSWDGILVLKSPQYSGIEKVEITMKTQEVQHEN